MNKFELQLKYKTETSQTAFDEEEIEFTVWRSNGQWILDITDAEKFKLSGNMGLIKITKPDTDYIQWLEEKLMELLCE